MKWNLKHQRNAAHARCEALINRALRTYQTGDQQTARVQMIRAIAEWHVWRVLRHLQFEMRRGKCAD